MCKDLKMCDECGRSEVDDIISGYSLDLITMKYVPDYKADLLLCEDCLNKFENEFEKEA